MKKIKKFNFTSFIISLLFVEMFFIFWRIDIIPILSILIVGCTAMILSYIDKKLSGEDELEEVEVGIHSSDSFNFTKILIMVLLCCVIFALGSFFVLFGVSVVSDIFLEVFLGSRIIRYLVYGVMIPCVLSYVFVLCYRELPVIHPLNFKLFSGLLLGFLFIGLFICIGWDLYDIIREYVLSLKLF